MPGEQKNLGMIFGDFLESILKLATAKFNFIMHRKDLLKTSRSFLCHYAISTPRQPVCRKRRCRTSGLSRCLLLEFKDDAALFPASWIDGQIVLSQAAFSVRLDFILWDEQDGHAEQ